ncbi:MAG: prephenate dehydratase [Planctomycetota bacterium]
MQPDSQSLDEIDRELLRQIADRVAASSVLAESGDLPSTAERNRVFAKLVGEMQLDEASTEALEQVLRHVDSYCRRSFPSRSISFLGPKYSYSHLAAIAYFGDAADFQPVASIPAVFDAVYRGDVFSGIVPIENSTDGGVVDTLSMFVKREMTICGEVLLPIHHNLLASGRREEITEIHSKPQALSQCRNWLMANFPAAACIEVSSTTAAAAAAAADTNVAAVASLPAGHAYGLETLSENIEDNGENVTRFAVLGKTEPEPTGDDKTSLLFQVEHKPGALAGAMNVFSDLSLNLTWIESFPCPETRSEYLFFVELSGHRMDPTVTKAIGRLSTFTRRLDILGSYPIGSVAI